MAFDKLTDHWDYGSAVSWNWLHVVKLGQPLFGFIAAKKNIWEDNNNFYHYKYKETWR